MANNDLNNWFSTAVTNGFIQVYPITEFKNVRYSGENAGEGRFSYVGSGEWPCTNRKVALKRFKNYDTAKFELEVKMHVKCHLSKNIVRFLGLTTESQVQPTDSYLIVMEYADLNNLRIFLQSNITLSWDLRAKLSLDIAKGLNYLHFRNIVHRDLHSNNIVISQIHHCSQREYIAKIADFGTAIIVTENMDNEDVSGAVGQIPFTDPKYLNDIRHYKKDRRSDIYSLGVILWEISSSNVPFEGFMPGSRGDYRDLCLTMEIICGMREEDIPLTPDSYSELYRGCWSPDENERPNIEEVIESLNKIIMAKSQEDTLTSGQE